MQQLMAAEMRSSYLSHQNMLQSYVLVSEGVGAFIDMSLLLLPNSGSHL